jgi:hypothetical protein
MLNDKGTRYSQQGKYVLGMQWQNSPILKCLSTRVPGSQTTHNSNYSLLNSKNWHTKRRIAPENNSISHKRMKIRRVYNF